MNVKRFAVCANSIFSFTCQHLHKYMQSYQQYLLAKLHVFIPEKGAPKRCPYFSMGYD
jgi:hypothetical protein